MTIARFYMMEAGEGKDTVLESALLALADEVRSRPGSAGVDVLHDAGDTSRFLFVEKWVSAQDYQNAKGTVSKETLEAVANACGKPSENLNGAYFDYLKTI